MDLQDVAVARDAGERAQMRARSAASYGTGRQFSRRASSARGVSPKVADIVDEIERAVVKRASLAGRARAGRRGRTEGTARSRARAHEPARADAWVSRSPKAALAIATDVTVVAGPVDDAGAARRHGHAGDDRRADAAR